MKHKEILEKLYKECRDNKRYNSGAEWSFGAIQFCWAAGMITREERDNLILMCDEKWEDKSNGE